MKYADLSKADRDLKKIPYDEKDGARNTAYYTAVEAFRIQLQDALRTGELLRKLTKPQLLKVIQWCSRHRPYEPHVILSTLARLAG